MNDTCKHCGKQESAHHAFEPVSGRPAGCVCHGAFYGIEPINPICDEFNPHNVWLYCSYCKHEKGCHKEELNGR